MNEIINKAMTEQPSAFQSMLMEAYKAHRNYADGMHPGRIRQIAEGMVGDCLVLLMLPKVDTLTFSQKMIAFHAATKALGIGRDEARKIVDREEEVKQ